MRGTATNWSGSSSLSDGEPSVTDRSGGSKLTGGVAVVEAVVEARVLALLGRGSVEVAVGSAEVVSASKVVTADAAGYVD